LIEVLVGKTEGCAMNQQLAWGLPGVLFLFCVCVASVEGQQPEPLLRLPNKTPLLKALSVSPDGRYLAYCGGFRHPIIVWDLTTNKQAAVLKTDIADFTDLLFSPDGRILVACHAELNRNTFIRAWAVDKWKELGDFGNNTLRRLAFSSNGRQLFTAGLNSFVTCWDITKQEVLWQKDPTNRSTSVWVDRLAVSPDDNWLGVTTARDPVGDMLLPVAVMVLNLKDRKEVFRHQRHVLFVSGIAFSPDSKYLASASRYQVLLYDFIKGTEVFAADTKGFAKAIAFTENGKSLLIGQAEQRGVLVLDVPSGKPLASFAEKQTVTGMAVFDGSKKVITFHERYEGDGQKDGILIWDLEAILKRARAEKDKK
jgi:WD40 repeat protein